MTEITRKRLFRLQRLYCSKSWQHNTVDCHRERDSILETLRGAKGIWIGKTATTPKHIVGRKKGAMGGRTIRRLAATKRSETSLLLQIPEVPWDLVLDVPRRGRRKKHLTMAPASPPVHESQTDDKSSSSTDTSFSSSSSTQALSGIPKHANILTHAQTNFRSQQQKAMEAKVLVTPTPTVLPTVTRKTRPGATSPTK